MMYRRQQVVVDKRMLKVAISSSIRVVMLFTTTVRSEVSSDSSVTVEEIFGILLGSKPVEMLLGMELHERPFEVHSLRIFARSVEMSEAAAFSRVTKSLASARSACRLFADTLSWSITPTLELNSNTMPSKRSPNDVSNCPVTCSRVASKVAFSCVEKVNSN